MCLCHKNNKRSFELFYVSGFYLGTSLTFCDITCAALQIVRVATTAHGDDNGAVDEEVGGRIARVL